MKKQLIFLIVGVCFAFYGKAQHNFTLYGEITRFEKPSKIFLEYQNGNEQVLDSAVLQDGKFTFNGNVNRPVQATLRILPLHHKGSMSLEQRMAMDWRSFYIDPGQITIKGNDLKTAIVQGGKTQMEYQSLQDQLSDLRKEMTGYQEKMVEFRKDKNEEAVNAMLAEIRKVRIQMDKIENDFIPKHPDSYIAFDMVQGKTVIINPQTFEPLYNTLSERLRNTEEGKAMKDRLAIVKRTAVGQIAPDFTQKDLNGHPVSLSSLRGKYILLDFWASWCGPCRAENPNVLKVYEQFKDKNFDVLAVSLDNSREKWIKAIKEDGMPWIHVSDLLGFGNTAAVLYGIQAIPQNFLIDPMGKIIATNLRGDELEQVLAETIKKE